VTTIIKKPGLQRSAFLVDKIVESLVEDFFGLVAIELLEHGLIGVLLGIIIVTFCGYERGVAISKLYIDRVQLGKFGE
jgi:hypothetical protein